MKIAVVDTADELVRAFDAFALDTMFAIDRTGEQFLLFLNDADDEACFQGVPEVDGDENRGHVESLAYPVTLLALETWPVRPDDVPEDDGNPRKVREELGIAPTISADQSPIASRSMQNPVPIDASQMSVWTSQDRIVFNAGYDAATTQLQDQLAAEKVQRETLATQYHASASALQAQLAEAKAVAIGEFAEFQRQTMQAHAYAMDESDWDEHNRLQGALKNYAEMLRGRSGAEYRKKATS